MSDKELDALEQLEKAELSPEGRRNVEALRAEIESREPEGIMRITRRALAKIFKWIVVPGLAVGGAAYVGKQAMDAFPTAVEAAAHREVNERLSAIQGAFAELQGAAGSLLLKLYDLLMAMKDKASSWDGASTLAVGVWDGLWKDGAEWWATGDKSPDKLISELRHRLSDDPVVSAKMDAVFASYEELKKKKDKLEAAGQGAFQANDQDAIEFYNDYKREFWKEMLGKGNSLSTSAPALESPKQ